MSHAFLTTARGAGRDPRSAFCAGDARSLPLADHGADAVVSGLALNFVPDPGRAVSELARVARPGAVVAAYVWDYADGMAMLRYFWDAAVALDDSAAELDEAGRFPMCRPDALGELWSAAGLGSVGVDAIEVPTRFVDFDDYWKPFLGGQGPAPGYVRSLGESGRSALRELLRARLPSGPDGSVALTARAWAVRGRAAPVT
jgi:SAM-dependent methyltransferase